MPDQAQCSCGCVNQFSSQDAEADLRRYRKDGPAGSTKALIDALTKAGVDGATLLDIGGGIGAIQLALLKAGAASVESVDATEAYVTVANAEASREGYGERTHGRIGDFVEIASEVESADLVTLDKVVCCYSDVDALLGRAADHAKRSIGLVYPRDAWWITMTAKLIAFAGWIRRDPIRWYQHPTPRIDEILRAAGFSRRDIRRDFLWQVAVFDRVAPAVTTPAG